jgi:hypothetical protein
MKYIGLNTVGLGLVVLGLLAGCAQPEREPTASLLKAKPGPSVFFVATNGNDSWSGRLAAPNASHTDGPFATPGHALEAVRQFRAGRGSGSNQPVAIYVRGGSYFLAQPLVLQPLDSGLLLAAFPHEGPVLSGGRRVGGWHEVSLQGRQLWAAELPAVREGKWFFRELWVNGQRATRARHPNHGYLKIAELPDKVSDWTQGHMRFRFHEGDFKAWASVTNAEVVAMTRWVESRLPVAGVDETARILSFSKRSVFELSPGDLYYAEGAFEFLDQPGEWYLDRATGTLYYLPRAGEEMSAAEVIAPRLEQVVRLEGQPEAGAFIDHVVFRGLTFAHTEWNLPDVPQRPKDQWEAKAEVGGFGQAAVGVPGAVWGQGVRACGFERCSFSRLGNYGLELTGGCQGNRIVGCEFSDLGAGGIKLGETRIRSNAAEQTRSNLIEHCRLYDGGHMFASAVGIWFGQTPDNRIAHNLIHDFFYTGISIGWTWGYGAALATNNTVEFNHVHHIGVKSDGDGPILSDMGGIYTLGRQPGTRICNNLWHDMAATRYGGWGIYFDEGSSGIVAESNLVYRTTHGGFHQHYGETNVLRNNIFAFGRDFQLQRTRPEPHLSFTFQTNIVYFDSGVLISGDWAGGQIVMDGNLYYDARPEAQGGLPHFGAMTWEQWRQKGHDRDSMIADPRFVAPRENDFRLQSDSPALKLGFRPLDLRAVPEGDMEKNSKP